LGGGECGGRHKGWPCWGGRPEGLLGACSFECRCWQNHLSREVTRRRPKKYQIFFVQVRDSRWLSSLLPQLTFVTDVDGP